MSVWFCDKNKRDFFRTLAYYFIVTGGEHMEGRKYYLQPSGTVLNTIHDIVEFLKGRPFNSDTVHGIINAHLTMYGFKWDIHFLVEDIGRNRSRVTIGIEGERTDKKREIRSMFALLDSMLLIGAEIEYADEQQSDEIKIIGSDNAKGGL